MAGYPHLLAQSVKRYGSLIPQDDWPCIDTILWPVDPLHVFRILSCHPRRHLRISSLLYEEIPKAGAMEVCLCYPNVRVQTGCRMALNSPDPLKPLIMTLTLERL